MNKNAPNVLPDASLKKRRLVSGKEIVFKIPGEENDDSDYEGVEHQSAEPLEEHSTVPFTDAIPIFDRPRITIHEED